MPKPKPSISKPVAAEAARRFALGKGRGRSGQVPSGDMRLTLNVSEELHLRLKLAAARQRRTMGEMIEDLIRERFQSDKDQGS